MAHTGYEKTYETRIIRTKHKVTFKIGTAKHSLIDMLSDVPDLAVVDEVIGDVDGEGFASIEFHEEKADS